MIPIEDIANLSLEEQEHADVGKLLYCMQDIMDQLIAIRVRDHGRRQPLLPGEFDELMAIKTNLEFLLSDIIVSRILK